jgi:hypothetical protein
MTDIYIDPVAAATPDAVDQLRHLTGTGHRVMVLGDLPATLVDEPSMTAADALPMKPPPGSWLLTADPERCADRRPPMQTMLVGPLPAPSPRPAPRCDTHARDLAAAVLEVLGREAMG